MIKFGKAYHVDVFKWCPYAYELYSWQTPQGEWNFSLFVSPSGIELPLELVLSKKWTLRGLDELKNELSDLPEGKAVLWLNSAPLRSGVKGSDNKRLEYPPQEIVDEVVRFAESHQITIDVRK